MSDNMIGAINNGVFGTSGPFMNPPEYPNNIIQFGGGYNPYQPQQTYSYYNANLYTPQQSNNGFVFQPTVGYQPQPPYSFNPYQQAQPQCSYYNPYGDTFSQQGMEYNPYYRYGYNGYSPFYTPAAVIQRQNEQVNLFKTKYRLANYYVGNEINEEYLDKMCNPQNPIYQRSPEEIKAAREFKQMQELSKFANGEINYVGQNIRDAQFLNLMSENLHKELDHHSMFQFFNDDLWKLQREYWIRDHIKLNGTRDLSTIYNSRDYNELLNLHNSSNPYVSQILDNSRYDNNLDDTELGLQLAFNRARRTDEILHGKVPTYVSPDETQRRRHAWTQQIMNNIYEKGSVNNV